ncbi:MAG: hypothetical protein AAGJ19_18945 [Myxococcota bacterium]
MAAGWRSVLFTGLLLGLACGDEEPNPDQKLVVDCSPCGLTELCWYTRDFDNRVSDFGCLDLPAACIEDRSCACISTQPPTLCDEAGGAQNSNACELSDDEEPLLFCVTTLG